MHLRLPLAALLLVGPVVSPAAVLSAQGTAPGVRYEIAFPDAAHHEARVDVTFAGVPAGPLRVRMSRGSPGRYAAHDFAKNVYDVVATDARGRALPVARPNAHQWDVSGHDGTVRFAYTVFGDRADGTYLGISDAHVHLNMPATFAYALGLEARAVTVRFRRPDSSWSIATQLRPGADAETFTAPHLQYFMDSPTMLGRLQWHEWKAGPAGREQLIQVAMAHTGTPADAEGYVAGTKAIVREAEAVFGGLPAFDFGRYTFLANYLPWSAGDGMEHRNSTSLTGPATLPAATRGTLGTVAHEFFHAWNVERIRPADLEPFDFADANISQLLWLAEGFTQYYGNLLMARAGQVPAAQAIRGFGGTANAVVNGAGRRRYGPVEMSRQAPFTDAAASIDPQNRANTFISYYTYGAAVALALDLELRQRTPARTLDDYMRELWRTHGAQRDFAPVRPYTLDDAESALARVSGDAAWARGWFARHVRGNEAPDYARLVQAAGVTVRRTRAGTPWLGDVTWRAQEGRLTVGGTVLASWPVYATGVAAGDRLVSVAGTAVGTVAELDAVLATRKPGDEVPLVFESRGGRRERSVRLGESPAFEFAPVEDGALTTAQGAFRSAWLGPQAR